MSASSEWWFSKLKFVLKYFKSTTDKERLYDLVLIRIDREELEAMNLDEIINNFAGAKVRNVRLK